MPAILTTVVCAAIGFVIAIAAPIVTVIAGGHQISMTLLDATLVPVSHGIAISTLVVALTLFVVPIVELGLLLWILVPLAARVRPLGFRAAMRVVHQLRRWRMIEVFLVGVGIAIVKLGKLATITPNWGVFGIAIMTVAFATLGSLDRDTLWRRYEELA